MKIAIVTGASTGIGRLIALRLCQEFEFDELWAIARGEEKLRALQEKVNVPVRPIPLDLSNSQALDTLRELLKEQNPDVRFLINGAGFGKFETFDRILEEDNLGMIDLNCRALTQITYLCSPYFSKGSKILNIASVAGFMPIPYGSVYSASKAFVLSFSRALNREYKSRGVQAIALCPYWTKTPFLDRSNKQSVISNFPCLYEPSFVAEKAVRALKKKRDYVVPGFTAKATHAMTKIFPHKIAMTFFVRQQKLHKK